MTTLKIADILSDKILISRETARLLEAPLNALSTALRTSAKVGEARPLALDFKGVEGMTPSFLDELVTMFESAMGPDVKGVRVPLILLNPPARLSLKFEGVARGHGKRIEAQPDGSWLFADSIGPAQ